MIVCRCLFEMKELCHMCMMDVRDSPLGVTPADLLETSVSFDYDPLTLAYFVL